jgi:hypothetical protein
MGHLSRFAAAHLLANAVILAAGYYWLGIPESRSSTLALSAAVALSLIAAVSITYGAAFAFFCLDAKAVAPAWRIAARNLLPLATASIAITAIYVLLALWQDYSSNPAFTLASFLTMTLRKPVKPAAVSRIFDAILFLLRWAIVPVALLPMLAAISIHGWSGFATIGRNFTRWRYYVVTPALLLIALVAPLEILNWKPHARTFGFEMISFFLRASAAYLLFAAAWLALAFATSAGKPRFTQSKTVVSP